jgi:hypothetical protein
MIYEEPPPYLIQWFGISPDNPNYMVFVFYPDTPLSHLHCLFGKRIRSIIYRSKVTVVFAYPE